MSTTIKRVGFGKIAVIGLAVMTAIFTIALLERGAVIAAEHSPYEMQQENVELRQIVDYFGTGPVFDAFVIAFRVPNLFRRVLGEEMFERAALPPFARLRAAGRAG